MFSSRRISDLHGIEFAMRLQTLNLRDNEITDVLPLAGLTRLTRLVLDGNPVENPEVLFRLKQGGTPDNRGRSSRRCVFLRMPT